jgi:hypothetical protein
VPAQIEVVPPLEIETDAADSVFTTIVTLLEVTTVGLAQVALLVSWQVTTSPLAKAALV